MPIELFPSLAANSSPLSPLSFLQRSAEFFPENLAVVWGNNHWTYGEFGSMVAKFMAYLQERGVAAGDVVSVMSTNRPEMLAAHYAVPMLGAVINTINTRLDTDTVTFILEHAESVLLLFDESCREVADCAADRASVPAVAFANEDSPAQEGSLYLLDKGQQVALPECEIADERQAIALNYTSGTTGNPKGVVIHHRGAYLNSLGNVFSLNFNAETNYLWTLPMFHCNGWCHTWAITAAAGVHVCLDKVDPALIFTEINRQEISHLACAPVVLYMLLTHAEENNINLSRKITVATGGAAPTETLLEQMDQVGFELIHLYGLTESFGPQTLRALTAEEKKAPPSTKAKHLARQGIRHITAGRIRVIDASGNNVPQTGDHIGEIVISGNNVMAGYLKNPEATEEAFAGDQFHTGDLAVWHADGSIEIKDRSKDIIISGGENISSLELESVLHKHPAVMFAAVVAAPDSKWGEVPCAFIELKPGLETSAEELRQFCRENLAGFKVPKKYIFCELPKTATGKIQKFQLRNQLSDN